jgi:nonsense-mediated mRNA decay protein 3
MNSQYFEAILQLRNRENSSFDEAAEKVHSEIENKGRADIFITKIEKVKGGIDFYLSSRKFAKSMGERLAAQFGGEFQANPRLFSRNRQTSKDVYRLNVLVRLPEIDLGSIVEKENTLYLVLAYGKGVMQARKLKTGKTEMIPLSTDVVIRAGPVMHPSVVTRKKPHVEVLDPESYQSIIVENCKETRKDKIKVVVIDGKAYSVE